MKWMDLARDIDIFMSLLKTDCELNKVIILSLRVR